MTKEERIKKFASRMQDFMEEEDMTRVDIIEKTGFHHEDIGSIIREKRLPSRSNARLIAEALNQSCDAFDDIYRMDDIEGEEWRPIPRYPEYEVSNMGRVMNPNRATLMKQRINDHGYYQTQLTKDGKCHTERVHRLVGEAFIEGGSPELDVNHMDGNKTNNRVENLEWTTRAENTKHAFDTGLKKPSRQQKVKCVETNVVYDSIRECYRQTDCNYSEISRQLRGDISHVKGYHFEIVNEE